MKSRQIYLDPFFAFGVVLVLLGAGNWVVGAVQVAHYRALMDAGSKMRAEDRAGGSGESGSTKSTEILGRIHEEREKYNAARIKVDFFYVVLRGGLLLLLMGLGFSGFAFVKTVRRHTPVP